MITSKYVVTFQVQIDPLFARDFSKEELREMNGLMMEFVSKIEKFKEYVRCEMFVGRDTYKEDVA